MNSSKHRREVERAKGPPPDPGPWVYITYTSEQETEKRRGQRPGRYDPKPDKHIHLKVTGLFRNQQGFFNDRLKVHPDVLAARDLFLVIARYTDGDSYQTTRGYHRFIAVEVQESDARAWQALIKKHRDDPGPDFPWGHTFSHLEDVEVIRLPLLDGEVCEES